MFQELFLVFHPKSWVNGDGTNPSFGRPFCKALQTSGDCFGFWPSYCAIFASFFACLGKGRPDLCFGLR